MVTLSEELYHFFFFPSHALRRPESLFGKCVHENRAFKRKESGVRGSVAGVALCYGLRRGARWRHVVPITRLEVSLDLGLCLGLSPRVLVVWRLLCDVTQTI